MVYMKDKKHGYVKSITGEAVEWTDALVDAFDFFDMPSLEEQAQFIGMVLPINPDYTIRFVSV